MKRIEIGDAVLYEGDCREFMKNRPTLFKAHSLITDPPYGVGLGEHGSANETRPGLLKKQAYASYDDTPESFEKVVVPAIESALAISDRGMVFSCPPSMWKLPAPKTIGGIYIPGGCGRTSWGWTMFSYCLLYGVAPDLHLGCYPTIRQSIGKQEDVAHPCPKPVDWMEWAVGLGTRPGQVVFDPFMGSGTTGVAALKLGRKFVGVEIEPAYFDVACERVENAQRQERMFA